MYGTAFVNRGRPLNLLRQLEVRARDATRIRKLMNTILANGAYSDVEEEKQIRTANQVGNLNDRELDLLHRSWAVRRKITDGIMNDLDELLRYEENKT